MPAKPRPKKTYSIAELAKEFAQPRVRVYSALPKDDWWFPDYAPSWARMLSRDGYFVAHSRFQPAWIREQLFQRMPKRKRGRPPSLPEETAALPRPPGRPKETTPEELADLVRLVDEVKANLKNEGRHRASELAALKIIYGNAQVANRWRMKLSRYRELHKTKP